MWKRLGGASLLLIGCGAEAPTFAVTSFDLGRPNPNEASIVAGLNLDDRVSDGEDQSTCGKEDYTSPGPDFEKGVDNQFGPLLDLAPTDPTAAVAPAIESGAFTLPIAISELNDREEDELVLVDVAGARFTGAIQGGRLSATSSSLLAIDLPVTDANGATTIMPMRLMGARLRMTVTEDRIASGIIGGYMPVREAVDGAIILDFAPEEALLLVLGTNADLDPDGEGTCQNISAGFVFEAALEETR